jgi:hypothetical protein
VQVLKTLLTDSATYEQRSRAAYAAANQFVRTLSIDPLIEQLQTRLARKPSPQGRSAAVSPPSSPTATSTAQRLQAMTPQQREQLMQMVQHRRKHASQPLPSTLSSSSILLAVRLICIRT